MKFFLEQNPFQYEGLCNIANGVHAAAAVNADVAKELGDPIIAKLIGKRVSDYSFKRKDQAVTMNSKHSIKVGGEVIPIDPQLLFQRLTMAGSSDLEKALQHELCTFPPALFETQYLLHEAQKSNLASALWTTVKLIEKAIPDDVRYVLDGGALLHKLTWICGSTYLTIVQKYVDFVIKMYGQAVVVFDGYTGASTKDMTRKRRVKGKHIAF